MIKGSVVDLPASTVHVCEVSLGRSPDPRNTPSNHPLV